jgi:hypothetical protein
MLQHTSKHVRDCHARAADCRQRAEAAADEEMRAFWLAQEERWLRLAASEDLASRVTTYLESGEAQDFSPEAEDAVTELVRVFNRTCTDLNLDLSDGTMPRKIAHTIIMAALEGENDTEMLYQRAVRAISN